MRRSFNSHAQFFVPHLFGGLSVLDCGCGSGTITLGIAARVRPGRVVGVDVAEREIERAHASLSRLPTLKNLNFQVADIYALPFEDESFDRAFSHALLEHLAEPVLALREIRRVLRPGGVFGLASSDWGGSILLPPSEGLVRAIAPYRDLQLRNGVDVDVGRKLGECLIVAGFDILNLSARYEMHRERDAAVAQLTGELDGAGDAESAAAVRSWREGSSSVFAEPWLSAIARKPV